MFGVYGIVHVYGTIHVYCTIHIYGIVNVYGIVHEYGGANNSYLGASCAYNVVVWINACLRKFCQQDDKSLRSLDFKQDRCDPFILGTFLVHYLYK